MASLNQKELSDIIYSNPIGSRDYNRALKQIQILLKPKYDGENIMVVDSQSFRKSFDQLNPMNHTVKWSKNISDELLNLKYSAYPGQLTSHYMPRYKIEHDLRYKQIMVCGIVETEEFLYLFQNPNRQLRSIGGHVDFYNMTYQDSDEILYHNMRKEFDEEIQFTFQNTILHSSHFDFQITHLINSDDTYYNLRNISVIFKITPKEPYNTSRYLNTLSNQPDLYSVHRIDRSKFEPTDHLYHGHTGHILRLLHEVYKKNDKLYDPHMEVPERPVRHAISHVRQMKVNPFKKARLPQSSKRNPYKIKFTP